MDSTKPETCDDILYSSLSISSAGAVIAEPHRALLYQIYSRDSSRIFLPVKVHRQTCPKAPHFLAVDQFFGLSKSSGEYHSTRFFLSSSFWFIPSETEEAPEGVSSPFSRSADGFSGAGFRVSGIWKSACSSGYGNMRFPVAIRATCPNGVSRNIEVILRTDSKIQSIEGETR